MPRGFQKDEQATKARVPAFENEDSFVSRDGHELLYGADKTNRRKEIYERDKGICQYCGLFANWEYGQWHHTYIETGEKRCDCMHGGKWSCAQCHDREHEGRAPRFEGLHTEFSKEVVHGEKERQEEEP